MSDTGHDVEVRIFGQIYPVRADVASEEYIRKIARFVDDKMNEINKVLKPSSSSRVAILTALNLADELFTLKEKQDQLKKEYSQKLKEYSKVLDRGLDG